MVHNQIWITKSVFCLPEGGSYDTDVTIHLEYSRTDHQHKETAYSFKLFNCIHTTKCLRRLQHRTYNIHRYNIKMAWLT
jgi:hypothetical protein